MKLFRVVIVLWMISTGFVAVAQRTEYDLGKLFREKRLTVYNRHVHSEDGKTLKADTGRYEGIVWLDGVVFSSGTIGIALKGKDVLQGSFLGIAFHGVNDSTYDVIYFRPFNFRSADPVRKIHAVQYISHPQYGWKKLREEYNGIYEKGLISPPDPDAWFHTRIVVIGRSIQVFVNDDKTPVLVVEALNDRASGKLGLWVGDGSDGEFKDLVVTQKK